ncbi:hypothetical protein HOY34_10425 [Xinfangfangia sp. D13-10-4-6]|uniref:pilus assembly protein TadG-related protein n=1 Tax=Pseudogemmobacter hezensis TaxID=2737662 RepID=UPI001556659A|nr:pilus assembly protein TadG-related protein [Pseudogemmobacter hezensis]NPD15616.1 hypothetical protein [Pseudogemmobacter hezensis]
MQYKQTLPKGGNFRQFTRDQSGAVSVATLFLLVLALLMAGVAVDSANAWRMQNRLQIAADAAALGAAAQLPDREKATEIAQELMRRNLDAGTHTFGPSDLRFGSIDETGAFFEHDDDAEAVRVDTGMTEKRGNPLGTMFLRLVGVPTLSPSGGSIAVSSGGDGTNASPGCEDAMILTDNSMDIGGGNTLDGKICLHGRNGLHTGGNDWYSPEVRLSAQSAQDVTVNHVRQGSATAEQVRTGSDLRPVVLPKLQSMFDELWAALEVPDANGRDLQVDGYYTGDLLPDFLKDAQGRIAIVYIDNGWWTAQPGDLKPNTVYVVNHGMQIAGNVQAQKVGIIAKGQIGIGGGPNLHYTDNFFFATGMINSGGDIQWGDAGKYCENGRYSVYTFSVNSTVSLGGWGGGAGAHGLFGAAPGFNPGGAMRNSGGLYFEARNFVPLGGNLKFNGCGKRLNAEYDQALPEAKPAKAAGSRIVW